MRRISSFDTDAESGSAVPTNLGKVWVNRPAVQIQARRDTDRPKSYGGEIDFLGVWIAIAALAVVVAVFGPLLGGQW